MITLSLLKLLENAGLGEIDKDLFWEKLALNKVGVYIADIGQERARNQRRSQRFELYARGKNDIDGRKRLDKIVEYLNGNYQTICSLPAIEDVSDSYKNVTIMPLSTPTSVGEDSTGRIIWSASGEIYY